MGLTYAEDSIKALNEQKATEAQNARGIGDKIEQLMKGQEQAQGQVLDAYEALAAVFESNLALSDTVTKGQEQAQGQVLDAYEALATVFEDNLSIRTEFAALRDEFSAFKEQVATTVDASIGDTGDTEPA